jgi:hypothetical protein
MSLSNGTVRSDVAALSALFVDHWQLNGPVRLLYAALLFRLQAACSKTVRLVVLGPVVRIRRSKPSVPT